MENKNKKSKLRSLVSLGMCYIPSFCFMYEMSELYYKSPQSTQDYLFPVIEIGTMALMIGGLQIGDKLGKFLEDKFYQKDLK